MKIAICAVQTPFVKGGAETHTLGLYNEMIKRGYDVEYINIPFKWYPPIEVIKHSLVWRMIDLTESNGEKIDLLICTKFPSYIVKHPNKVVWLLHQYRQAYELYDSPYSDLKNIEEGKTIRDMVVRMDNMILKECKKIFTNSKNVALRLKKYNKINGTPLYHPPKNSDKFYCKDFDNYFIYPSRLDVLKRFDIFIKAMQYVDDNIKAMIVGKGPMENKLVSMVRQLGLNKRVQFHGYISDDELINLYANSTGVVYIPYEEDFGYVTLEAFLSKKPVITAYDSGGPLEFVENNINGYVVKPNPKDIAKKINYLFENKDIAKDMGLKGYEKIKKINITWDNVIKELVG